MSTYGTNYGISELRIAKALQDAIDYYGSIGTMPGLGTEYGESEKRIAIAIFENTTIGGGNTAVWGNITGNLASQSDLSTALSLKQNTLVSGTNLKTINTNSLLGSGDITINTNPAGSSGQIQFNNSGSFGTNNQLFWDNTNNKLGINNNSPSAKLDLISSSSTDVGFSIKSVTGQTANLLEIKNSSGTVLTAIASNGIQTWRVGSAGFISCSSPGAMPGLIFQNLALSQRYNFNLNTTFNSFVLYADDEINTQMVLGSSSVSPFGTLGIRNMVASRVGLSVQAATSQAANIAEIKNSINTVISVLAKSDGSYQPANLTDVSSTNNSVYFSSTTSRFTYKHSDGTISSFSGTNTGDQSSIVGITGTTAQFNTALTDGDFTTLSGTETLTNKVIIRKSLTQIGNYTLTSQDDYVRFNGTNLTATLPDAATLAGYQFEIKNLNATNLAINTTSSQLMDANSTVSLVQYEVLKVVSNGTNWDII